MDRVSETQLQVGGNSDWRLKDKGRSSTTALLDTELMSKIKRYIEVCRMISSFVFYAGLLGYIYWTRNLTELNWCDTSVMCVK